MDFRVRRILISERGLDNTENGYAVSTIKDVDTQKYPNNATKLIAKIIKTVVGIISIAWLENIRKWYKMKFVNVSY